MIKKEELVEWLKNCKDESVLNAIELIYNSDKVRKKVGWAIPPCYRLDKDGCVYFIRGENDDMPIDRCIKYPLCKTETFDS